MRRLCVIALCSKMWHHNLNHPLAFRLQTNRTLKPSLLSALQSKYNMDYTAQYRATILFKDAAKVLYFTVPVTPNRSLLLQLLCSHSADRRISVQGRQRARAAEGQRSFITAGYFSDPLLKIFTLFENEQMDEKISLCAAPCTKRAECLLLFVLKGAKGSSLLKHHQTADHS